MLYQLSYTPAATAKSQFADSQVPREVDVPTTVRKSRGGSGFERAGREVLVEVELVEIGHFLEAIPVEHRQCSRI